MSAEVKEDFECSISPLVKELETERLMSIEVTLLAEGEYRCQLPTTDVHIERFGADVQEAVCVRKFPELTMNLDRGCSVR